LSLKLLCSNAGVESFQKLFVTAYAPGFVKDNGDRTFYFLALTFALQNNLNVWLKSSVTPEGD